jgi:hypothetical protein
MNTITIEDLTEKLKYAPSSILEKIWGYADALLENGELSFTLSDEQKKILTDQDNISLDECTDAEDFYKELKGKYEL